MSNLDENKIHRDNAPVPFQPLEFTPETVLALQEFGEVLLRIHKRLVAEGKIIKTDKGYVKRNPDG